MSIEIIGALIPVIIGLVGVFTMAGLDKKFAPVLSLIFGVLLVLLSVGFKVNYQIILVGIMTGLSASGLYSGAKTTAGAISGQK